MDRVLGFEPRGRKFESCRAYQLDLYMPRHRAAAIVIHNDQLLVIFRKNTQEYFVFPGGGIERSETSEQAIIREIQEETSLEIRVDRQVYELHHDNGDIHYYFLCRYVSSVPAIRAGTNEFRSNQRGDNTFIPRWEPLQKLPTITLYPTEVRDRLLSDLIQGFSDQVVTFNLKGI